jgi:hypothetical protein
MIPYKDAECGSSVHTGRYRITSFAHNVREHGWKDAIKADIANTIGPWRQFAEDMNETIGTDLGVRDVIFHLIANMYQRRYDKRAIHPASWEFYFPDAIGHRTVPQQRSRTAFDYRQEQEYSSCGVPAPRANA